VVPHGAGLAFRVKLDPGRAPVSRFESFDQSVLAPKRQNKVVSEFGDGLNVKAVHGIRRGDRRGKVGVRFEGNIVLDRLRVGTAWMMRLDTTVAFYVAVEGPAVDSVDELHPIADPQDGKSFFQRGFQGETVRLVSFVGDRREVIGQVADQTFRDSRSTRDHKRVDPRDGDVHRFQRGQNGDHKWDPTRKFYGRDVVRVERQAIAGLADFVARRDPDGWGR